jgi:hypothetical protein
MTACSGGHCDRRDAAQPDSRDCNSGHGGTGAWHGGGGQGTDADVTRGGFGGTAAEGGDGGGHGGGGAGE